MNLQEELKTSFKIYDNITDKILEKCEELCLTYSLSAEDLADQWGAYSISNLNSSIPTLEGLKFMERKEFKQNKDNSFSNQTSGTPKSVQKVVDTYEEQDSHLLSTNLSSTPKSTRTSAKRSRSPDQSDFQKESFSLESSLTSTPSTHDFNHRTNSGKVELSYGIQNLLSKATFRRTEALENEISIRSCLEDNLSCDVRYMYNVMSTKVSNLNSLTEWIGKYLINKFELGEAVGFSKASGLVTTYGRICSDTLGKLHPSTVLLEGSQDLSHGNTITLNLTKVPSYAIFPGQIVAVQGFNPNGTNFVTQKLYSDASVNSTTKSKSTLNKPLQVVVGVGPFTLSNNLSYQPLQDLVKYVTANKPHVLILIGPFLDTSQETVCDITMTEVYSNFFETLLESVMSPLEGLNIDVILVPSSKDAHHHIVYPTPPYKLKKIYPNLHCFSDPCLIDINGLTIGATSADVLLHLSKQEFCNVQGGDRISRLASHLLCQQSFYPLYPPDEDVCLDYELMQQHGMINIIPNLLILPSNLRYFIKYVNGCVVINPERITKGYVGGTFSRIEIFPTTSNTLLSDSIVAQIVRV